MSGGPSFWRRLLNGWLAIAGHFGEVQTLVLLGVVYGLVIGPIALISRVARRDFLAKRGLGETGTAWTPAEQHTNDIERSRHPF